MKIVVIGIGNLIASDDGVGIESVRDFQKTFHDERVTCLESERGGLDLLDLMTGFDAAIVVDAAKTGGIPGCVTTFMARKPFAMTTHRSLHTMGLDSVLAFGSFMGVPLPDEVTVLAVEASDIETFREGCTEEVQSAIPDVVRRIRREVLTILSDPSAAHVPREEIIV